MSERTEVAPPKRLLWMARKAGLSPDEYMQKLALGLKCCTHCHEWKAADASNFNRQAQKTDGLNVYCLPCNALLSRTAYHKRAAALPAGEAARRVVAIDPALFPPAPEGERIGCLQCRHASIGFETDFKPGTVPMIRCGRNEGREQPICWQGCPIADPRGAKPRHLHKYTARWGPLGDRPRGATPLLIAFLKVRWSNTPADQLETVTGWNEPQLAALVRYHGIGGALSGNNRLHLCGGASQKKAFTPKQSRFIMGEYCSERWPQMVTYNMGEEEKKRRLAQRRKLVREVRALAPDGPKWTWEQLGQHALKRMRKHKDHAAKVRRGESRRVNQYVSIPMKSLPKLKANNNG